MSHSPQPTTAVHMPLYFFGTNLESVSVHNHLCLTLPLNLKRNNYVGDTSVCAERKLCQLEALRLNVNRETLEIICILCSANC